MKYRTRPTAIQMARASIKPVFGDTALELAVVNPVAAGSGGRWNRGRGLIGMRERARLLVESWRAGADRRIIAASATSVGSALAVGAYLIRTINIPLLGAMSR